MFGRSKINEMSQEIKKLEAQRDNLQEQLAKLERENAALLQNHLNEERRIKESALGGGDRASLIWMHEQSSDYTR